MSDQTPESTGERTIVIDLGKKKRKAVNKLRKGEGALMDRLGEVLAELRADGQLRENVDTVIVVVEKKPKKMFGLQWCPPGRAVPIRGPAPSAA